MATFQFNTSNIARMGAGAVIVIGALFHSASSACAQQEEPIRARQALRLAVERYKSGDLENAAKYFALAEAGKKYLTTPDQQDLSTFGAQNELALKNRQIGSEQIRYAEQALLKGQTQEAAGFLSALNANPNLTQADRDKLADLSRKVQAQPVAASKEPSKTDAKSLLSAGRAALQAGDLANAESLAMQAEKASSTMSIWLQPWSDSPAKLHRDIQSAKAKQQQPLTTAKNDAEPKNSSWIPGLNWFGKGEKETPKNPDADPSKPAASGFWPFGGAAKKEPEANSERSFDERIARKMVGDGYLALEAGKLDIAQMFAMKAKEHNATYTGNEPTPDTLLQEIQRRSSNPNAPLTTTAKKPGQEPAANGDPRAMLKLARNLIHQKKFDDADKLCTQALNVKSANWGLFEDTPDKCRRDIVRQRQTHEREESYKVMAEARKHFTVGEYEEAERKAYLAQKMHGPYGIFDFGDRPAKLLEEIGRAKPAKGPNEAVAKKDPTPLPDGPNKVGPTPQIPAEMQAAKNRAIVMVREARELERQGLLLEARQKAHEARMLQVSFLPEEDSPDNVVGSVNAKCEKQIQMLLQQMTEMLGSNDPDRLAKANAQLGNARQLAQAFNLDLGRIDQADMYLKQIASGATPKNGSMQFVGLSKQDVSTGDPQKDAMRKLGREKLMHAQTELSHGKLATARKMAEELYHPQYGIQEDVLRLFRSISAEEHNQQILEAKRTFDAGLDAFVAKDYRRAMSVFQSIDPMTLPEPYQARLRDIMSTREMQPQAIVQASHQQTLKGQPIDAANPPAPGTNAGERDNYLEEHKAREIVQIQMLRTRGIEAVRIANEMFKLKGTENKEQAIDTLQHYMKQVADSGLEPAKTNDLRRLPESRIQQYRMLMAQEKLDDRSRNNNFAMYHDEGAHQAKIAGKQQEIYEKMKLVNELMKQNKLQEARVAVKQVREVDRDNVAALAAERILETRINQENWDRGVKSNEKAFLDWLPQRLTDQDVSDKNPVAFNPEITKRNRSNDGSIPWQNKDPKERAIEYRLKQPISLNFRDVPLRQAIADLAIQSGVQTIPDLGPLQDERVNLDAPLSISVADIEMRAALNIMLNPLKLTYVVEDQVLKITTENRTKKRNVRVTYPIADLVIPVENHGLPDVLNILKALERTMSPAQFQMGTMTQSAYPYNYGNVASHNGGGLGSQFGSQGQPQPGYTLTPDGQTPKRNPEQMADLLMTLVKNAVQKQTWEDVGGNGVIQFFPLGMALVINQTQEVQEEVQQLLASLRKLQDLQVSVELRAVLVSESFFERIGVDFDMNIRTPTNRNEPNLLDGTFVAAPFANRTADKLGGLISGLTSAGTLTPDLNIPIRNNTFNFTTPQFGGYQPEAGLSLGLAFFSDIQVFMFLEAVQGDRRAHIMQAPKLTVFNGQQATIAGFMTRPSVTSLAAQPLGNGTFVMVPITTQIPFGLGMTVQPVVSPDRRFIRLNVSPQQIAQVQDPTASIRIPVPVQSGAVFDGGAPQVPFANNPVNFIEISQSQTNLTIANTTVNVPDGGTVLLGGFKFLAEERSEYGPPVLSKIPYLSRLFRNVGWSRDGSTLIYLITARVIMVEEEEQLFLGQIPPIPGR